MSLPRSLRAFAPLSRQSPLLSPRRASSDRRASCDDPPPPPCPPCPPKRPPPCRCPLPERLRATRLTCCPPSSGMRPPCEPSLPACALTCDRLLAAAAAAPLSSQQPELCPQMDVESAQKACRCDAQVDPVAKRLRRAEEMRHADYVCELAQREAPPPEPAPYRLAGDRECANAIDGGEVTLLRATTGKGEPAKCPGACGPCRTPPPPQCLEIARDTACRPGKEGLDPCAHRARVLLAVSRTTTDGTADAAANANNQGGAATNAKREGDSTSSPFKPCCGAQLAMSPADLQAAPADSPATPGKSSIFDACGANEGITSRIMKALGGGSAAAKRSNESGSGQTCAKKPCGTNCQTRAGEAQFAGDHSWCGKYSPPPAPAKCREPTQVERLRRRCRCPPFCGARATPPTTTRGIPPAARHFHTSAPSASAPDMAALVQQSKMVADKLEAALKERAGYKEASRGRVVRTKECGPCAPPPPAPPSEGTLELPVPFGATAVRLNVSVGALPACPAPPAPAASADCAQRRGKKVAKGASPCAASPDAKAGAKGCGSLLKSLQKKLTRCSGEPTQGGGKCPKKGCGLSPCESPCAPKPLVCPPKAQPACDPPPAKETLKRAKDSACSPRNNQNDSKKPCDAKNPIETCARRTPVFDLLDHFNMYVKS